MIKDKFDYDGKTLYENQLYIFDISPNAYSFQCQGSGFAENISFRAKGGWLNFLLLFKDETFQSYFRICFANENYIDSSSVNFQN